jgi:hypothetical protein
VRGRGGRCGARESEGASVGALGSCFIKRGGEESPGSNGHQWPWGRRL